MKVSPNDKEQIDLILFCVVGSSVFLVGRGTGFVCGSESGGRAGGWFCGWNKNKWAHTDECCTEEAYDEGSRKTETQGNLYHNYFQDCLPNHTEHLIHVCSRIRGCILDFFFCVLSEKIVWKRLYLMTCLLGLKFREKIQTSLLICKYYWILSVRVQN